MNKSVVVLQSRLLVLTFSVRIYILIFWIDLLSTDYQLKNHFKFLGLELKLIVFDLKRES